MKKECGICGGQYTGRRKIDHIKRSHRPQAYEFFISTHIKNKICDVCKNTTPFVEDTESHVREKHLPRAAKELAQNTLDKL